MESVRKDVECAFGVLKGRFRCLKLPIQLHSKDVIDDMFYTCVGLHNMLHMFDGRDRWEMGMDWEGADGNHQDEKEDEHWKGPRVRRRDGDWELVHPERDDTRLGSFYFGVDDITSGDEHLLSANELAQLYYEVGAPYAQLQEKLVQNFRFRAGAASVGWLRS